MNIQDNLKPIARVLKKEWMSLDMEKVGASKHEYGIALKSRFKSLKDETIVLSALLTPGINPEKNLNLVMDATLPESPPLEKYLPALSAFMQQATAVLSPMTVVVDMRTNQIVLRQSQLMSLDYPTSTVAFFNAIQVLIPMLQKTISSICEMNPTPDDARQMADLLSQSFYGALEE